MIPCANQPFGVFFSVATTDCLSYLPSFKLYMQIQGQLFKHMGTLLQSLQSPEEFVRFVCWHAIFSTLTQCHLHSMVHLPQTDAECLPEWLLVCSCVKSRSSVGMTSLSSDPNYVALQTTGGPRHENVMNGVELSSNKWGLWLVKQDRKRSNTKKLGRNSRRRDQQVMRQHSSVRGPPWLCICGSEPGRSGEPQVAKAHSTPDCPLTVSWSAF